MTPRFCIILLATYSLLCQFVVLGNLGFWTTFNISDPLQPPVYFELFSTLLATFRKMLDKPHNPLFSSRTSKAELGALPARSKRGWRSGLRSTWPGSMLSPPLRRWGGMLVFVYSYWAYSAKLPSYLQPSSRYNWGPIRRFGGGRGQEFATAYSVQYWSSGAWHTYTNLTGHSVMTGNENTWEASVQQLVPPIVTSRVRVLPRSRHPRTVSNLLAMTKLATILMMMTVGKMAMAMTLFTTGAHFWLTCLS